MTLDPAQRQEARQIATELARLARSADVLPGTITERHTRCKIANKTAGRYLDHDQAQQAQRWIDNDRRIHELLARLEQIGIQRLQADHDTQKQTNA
jgi:hypothetical protein